MISFICFTPDAADLLGYLPGFISEDDDRPLAVQLDASYQHGGGWRPMQGWEFNKGSGTLHYPGDDPLLPIAMTKVGDETMLVYRYAWVVIAQKDGSFEVCRMD
jgi:hypothetical protein